MKKILSAIIFTTVLSTASLSWAQQNAAAPPAAPAAPAPAAAPTAAATPATASPAPAGAATAANPAAPAKAALPEGQLPAWLEYKPTYSGEESDIANPHRTAEEITTWAQGTAADILSFSHDNYKETVPTFKKYFVPQGWQLYINYLKDARILSLVGDGGYAVGTIVDQVPEIVNQGTSTGVYHWILRMPVTISFMKKDPVTGDTRTGASGRFYLFVDVMRVSEGGGDDGIAISNWRVMDAPK